MTDQKSPSKQTYRKGSKELDSARAHKAGSEYHWHYGRVDSIGFFEVAGRTITISWAEGGVTTQQGNITDEQWEIFKLAYRTTGKIAILSDEKDDSWMYDYRFLEVQR